MAMTQLEEQLLSACERLSAEFNRSQTASLKAASELRQQCEAMESERTRLAEQVTTLSGQVDDLATRVSKLSEQVARLSDG